MGQVNLDIIGDNDEVVEVTQQETSRLYWIVGRLLAELSEMEGMLDSVSFLFIMDIYEQEFSEENGEMVMERDGHRFYIRPGRRFYHEESHCQLGCPSYLTNLGGERLLVTTTTYGGGSLGDIVLWVFRFNKADA